MDITRQVELQEEREQLQLQQNAFEIEQKEQIFKADLEAQEEERKRIAESLHNGIGQLLYAVKMSLSMVDLNRNPDAAALYQIKQATEQLLVEAIKESRRVSHALTPIILEEFGLKSALEDLCKHSEKEVPMRYDFTGHSSRLDKFVEISIYRIVQELITTVLKNAGATKARLLIEHQQQYILITLTNNGKGSNSDQLKHQDSRLNGINNRLRLLKGSLELKVSEGTEIRIHIPLEQ
jgi:signal transduction histidine kinase